MTCFCNVAYSLRDNNIYISFSVNIMFSILSFVVSHYRFIQKQEKLSKSIYKRIWGVQKFLALGKMKLLFFSFGEVRRLRGQVRLHLWKGTGRHRVRLASGRKRVAHENRVSWVELKSGTLYKGVGKAWRDQKNTMAPRACNNGNTVTTCF